MTSPTQALIDLANLACEAGKAIMDVYHSDFKVETKADSSPVTDADQRGEQIILAGLKRLDPKTSVIAEEQMAAGHTAQIGSSFYLVDPLDGTKEFTSRNGEFTVNIALIQNGEPVRGVVYAPALDLIYIGEKGLGAFSGRLSAFTAISVRNTPANGATVLASRSHLDKNTEDFIAGIKVEKLISAGSSLKFCRVAEGAADIYPRFGRTMEWDTAAGHAVLAAAGGSVTQPDGSPFHYGKAGVGFENPPFIARGAV